MRRKKMITLLLAAVMSMAALAGCTVSKSEDASKPESTEGKQKNKTADNTDAKEEVTLSFLANETPVLTRDFWQVVVDKYMKETPNVTIELVFQPSSNISVREHAKTLLSTGQFPDIMVMPTPNDFVPSGALMSFDDEDVSMLNPDYISRIDGEIYVVPYKIQVGGVFYNKNIFQENSLQVPATWAEFESTCETLKGNGITPVAMGLKDGWPQTVPFFSIQTVDLLNETPDWPAQRMASKTTFSDTPEFVEGIKKFHKLANVYGPKDRTSTTYVQTNESFFNEKAAMYVMGSWLQGDEMNTPHDFEVGFFPMPGDDGEKVMPLWINEGLSISSKTQHPDVAKDFVRFFIQDKEWASNFLQTEQLFTPLKEAVIYEASPLHQEIEAIMPEYKGIPQFYDSVGDNAWFPGVADLYNKFTLKIASDPDVDIEGEIRNLDMEFDKIIENNQK